MQLGLSLYLLIAVRLSENDELRSDGHQLLQK